jgi:hypothetical protein
MRYKKSSIIDDGCTKSLNFGVVSWHQTLIFKNKKLLSTDPSPLSSDRVAAALVEPAPLESRQAPSWRSTMTLR